MDRNPEFRKTELVLKVDGWMQSRTATRSLQHFKMLEYVLGNPLSE